MNVRPPVHRFAALMVSVLAVAAVVCGSPTAAEAGAGGRFTFMRPGNAGYWGVTFAGAGLGEIPFAIDTDGRNGQELAVYYNGRFTVRRDDGSYWGVTMPGAGLGETPLAIDTNGDGIQEFAVYYNGRFTMLSQSLRTTWGFTFAGAGVKDLPLAVDTNRDGIQEFAVYRSGRFTFFTNNSYWGLDFAGANSRDLPFVADLDGNGSQELAVYRQGRMTVRNDDGGYWGVDFAGAGMDEYPLAVDTNGDRRQELTVYSHVVNMVFAKQILAGRLAVNDYSENTASDRASHSLASQQLTDLAQGAQQVNLSTRCHQGLPPTTTADPRILQFLTDLTDRSGTGISVLFGQCHSSSSSYHYKGMAVDFTCPNKTATAIPAADQAGARYGIWHNFENCHANQHLHYSIGGH